MPIADQGGVARDRPPLLVGDQQRAVAVVAVAGPMWLVDGCGARLWSNDAARDCFGSDPAPWGWFADPAAAAAAAAATLQRGHWDGALKMAPGITASGADRRDWRVEMRRVADPVSGEPAVAIEARLAPLCDALLLAAGEATAAGIAITDAVAPDFPLLYVNPAFAAISGYSRDEALGRRYSFLQGAGTSPVAVAALGQGLAERRPVTVEMLNYRKDGTPFRTRVAINPIPATDRSVAGFIFVQSDITPERDLEDKLRAVLTREHQRIVAAVDSANDAIAVADPAFRIVYVNDAFNRLVGLDRTSQLLGSPLLPALGLNPAVDATKLEKTGTWSGDAEAHAVDGRIVPVSVRMNRIVSDTAGDLGFMVVLTDVSMRRRIESERDQLRSVLYHAQKMEAIGTLASGIAHDFNNFLSSVLGFVWLARQDLDEGATAELLDRALRAGGHARSIVQQLMLTVQPQAEEITVVALGTMVRDAVALLQTSLPAGVDLGVDIADEPVLVAGDVSQLHQLVMNLVINGAQAIAGPGSRGAARHLTVSVDAVAVSGKTATAFEGLRDSFPMVRKDRTGAGWARILVGLLPAGRYGRMRFADTGRGIPVTALERIFEPFFTTKDKGKGTGLGLAVVHGIVKGHGGGITVESAPGEGTVIDVLLPLTAADADLRQSAPAAVAMAEPPPLDLLLDEE
ncbi:MAG: PAS domain-containing protein [Azospirillaceae bacterium]|nr:PAS domain-containing protein [Azospirillaceae bacterium]